MAKVKLINKVSGAVSIVTQDQWEEIQAKGWGRKYKVEPYTKTDFKPSFIPQEVKDMRKAKESKDDKPSKEDTKSE